MSNKPNSHRNPYEEKIIKIMMKRDDLPYQEAKAICAEAKEQILIALANDDYEEAEDIFTSEIGLEIDYMIGFLL